MESEGQTAEIQEFQPDQKEVAPPPVQKFTAPKKKPLLIIGLAVLVLLLLATTGYFAYQNYQLRQELEGLQLSVSEKEVNRPKLLTPTPTPDITATWQTYTNEEYGLTFKYPSDYFLSDQFLKILPEDTNSLLGIILVKKKNKEEGQPPTIYLNIVRTEKSTEDFLEYDHRLEMDSWNDFWKDKGYDEPYIISEENVSYGSLTALKTERQRVASSPHSKETSYLIKKDNLIYILSVRYGTYNPDSGEDGTDEKNTLDQIFTTFQFTGGEQTSGAENWKTYTDLVHKISFKYPASWIYEEFEIQGKPEHHGLIKLKPKEYEPDIPVIPLFVAYWDNPENLTVEEFDQKINEDVEMRYPLYNDEAEMVKIDDVSAYYESKGDCSPFTCYKYVVSAENRIWEISSQYSKDPDEFKPVVDQIISTFEFTD
ncbi:MAG: PsbP-related protein [Bacteroidales bacterium]